MQKKGIADIRALRGEINDAIASNRTAEAWQLIAQLWNRNQDPSAASFVLSCVEKLRASLHLTSCRVAVLRSFTVEPCVGLLRAASSVNGIDMNVYVSDFNTYAQDILNENSGLYRFAPDIVFLAVQARDVAPDLWNDFALLSPEQIIAAINRVSEGFQNLVRTFRSRSKAHMVVHTLEMPAVPNLGLLDYSSENGQTDALRTINKRLMQMARENTGMYILDYDALVSRYGKAAWHDEQKWMTMRMPIAADHLIRLVREWLRFIHPLTGKVCKVLVTDLDNTLWGGVVGEDGFNGIKISNDYPGAAYQALQRAMLDLYQRGVLLAICSKNNLSDAMDVLEHHPGMLLRARHFAVMRINWNDKAQNLKEIAEELNIGTDALAFLDDNPTECQWVRSSMPEVTVIELPADPIDYVRVLRDLPVFERLILSAEDQKRGLLYAEQRLRAELQQSAESLEDFYRSLQMEVEIAALTPETLARVAQLTQKTNQFTMTTRRYSEQQIAEMSSSPDWRVYSMRVKDRFGDNGLVGVAITHYHGDVCEIDVFLLSCRVIGRTVETSLLAFVADEARLRGCRKLSGWFLPTMKNAPAKDFYPLHGFVCVLERNGESQWEFALTGDQQVAAPPWIRLHLPTRTEGMRHD